MLKDIIYIAMKLNMYLNQENQIKALDLPSILKIFEIKSAV